MLIQSHSPQSGLVSESYHEFDLEGICDLSETQVQVIWPAHQVGMERIFDSSLTLSIQPIDTGQYLLRPIDIMVNRSACPSGTSYDAVAQSCVLCLRTQYGMNFGTLHCKVPSTKSL